jgi:hypothetical protein
LQISRWRTWPRAEDEAEARVEADVIDQLHHLGEVVLGLAGKAHDEVAGQAQLRSHARSLRTVLLYSIAV